MHKHLLMIYCGLALALFSIPAKAQSPASATAAIGKHYPKLFGSRETRSDDIKDFNKWTKVIALFDEQMAGTAAALPQVVAWQKKIKSLRGKTHREQIEAVNAYLNAFKYIEDKDNYGKDDYWATPVEFLQRGGDCEDFAIAKYISLRQLGFSADELRVAIVEDKIKNIPHAILIVYADEGNFVLDNQNKQVRAMEAVNRYLPIFSINTTSWWLHRV